MASNVLGLVSCRAAVAHSISFLPGVARVAAKPDPRRWTGGDVQGVVFIGVSPAIPVAIVPMINLPQGRSIEVALQHEAIPHWESSICGQ
jgi:hypothetical protein